MTKISIKDTFYHYLKIIIKKNNKNDFNVLCIIFLVI